MFHCFFVAYHASGALRHRYHTHDFADIFIVRAHLRGPGQRRQGPAHRDDQGYWVQGALGVELPRVHGVYLTFIMSPLVSRSRSISYCLHWQVWCQTNMSKPDPSRRRKGLFSASGEYLWYAFSDGADSFTGLYPVLDLRHKVRPRPKAYSDNLLCTNGHALALASLGVPACPGEQLGVGIPGETPTPRGCLRAHRVLAAASVPLRALPGPAGRCGPR